MLFENIITEMLGTLEDMDLRQLNYEMFSVLAKMRCKSLHNLQDPKTSMLLVGLFIFCTDLLLSRQREECIIASGYFRTA